MRFSMIIGNFARETMRDIERERRLMILDLFNSVVLDTPVDTGMLRSNWRPSEGRPDDTNVGVINISLVMSNIQSVVSNAPLTDRAILYLRNNQPYAQRIEEGWSIQAPEGMVERNISRVTARWNARSR